MTSGFCGWSETELRHRSGLSRSCDSCFQLCFHLRPLVVQDAEVDAVADAACPRHDMAAQGALFFCADAEDGVARFLVAGIGLQFYARASPHFKGVTHH